MMNARRLELLAVLHDIQQRARLASWTAQEILGAAERCRSKTRLADALMRAGYGGSSRSIGLAMLGFCGLGVTQATHGDFDINRGWYSERTKSPFRYWLDSDAEPMAEPKPDMAEELKAIRRDIEALRHGAVPEGKVLVDVAELSAVWKLLASASATLRVLVGWDEERDALDSACF